MVITAFACGLFIFGIALGAALAIVVRMTYTSDALDTALKTIEKMHENNALTAAAQNDPLVGRIQAQAKVERIRLASLREAEQSDYWSGDQGSVVDTGASGGNAPESNGSPDPRPDIDMSALDDDPVALGAHVEEPLNGP